MFRKLYWVVERAVASGYEVAGVYTSIPDLLRNGIPQVEGGARLTLVKLDSNTHPLGSWTGPGYEGLSEALQQYVRTDEFSAEQCDALLRTLRSPVLA